MKDKKGLLLVICYIIELISGLVIIFFPDKVKDFLILLVVTIIIMWIIMMVVSIFEVVRSARIRNWEKVIWIIGLVSVFNLAGLVYILLRRWRVVSIQ